jgi:AraC-like DNA-binding protein
VNNDPDKEIMMDLGISELIIKLLRQQGRDVLLSYCQNMPDASGMSAVINYIEQHYTMPLDADQLAGIACMSRSRLYAEFKKHLDCSPGEFQQQIKLKNAADDIRLGRTITQACFDNGFNDLSHFSRRFTRFYGVSPRQFKQNHAK